MKDGGLVVERQLDVDQLPGPVPLLFLDDPPAEQEAIVPHRLGALGARQVVRAGQAKHPRPLGYRRVLAAGTLDRTGVLHGHQDLAQFDASIGPDHDELSASQRAATLRRGAEPPHMPHHTVTDQIGLLDHHVSPPLLGAAPRWFPAPIRNEAARRYKTASPGCGAEIDSTGLSVFTQRPGPSIIWSLGGPERDREKGIGTGGCRNSAGRDPHFGEEKISRSPDLAAILQNGRTGDDHNPSG